MSRVLSSGFRVSSRKMPLSLDSPFLLRCHSLMPLFRLRRDVKAKAAAAEKAAADERAAEEAARREEQRRHEMEQKKMLICQYR